MLTSGRGRIATILFAGAAVLALLRTYTGSTIIAPGVAQIFAGLLIMAMTITAITIVISLSPEWTARTVGFARFMCTAESSVVWSVASVVLLMGAFLFLSQMERLVYRTVPHVEGQVTPEYQRVEKQLSLYPVGMFIASELTALIGLLMGIRMLRRTGQPKFTASIVLAVVPILVGLALVMFLGIFKLLGPFRFRY